MPEGKHPSKRAQDWALAPAIGPAAAMHRSHGLDEPANDRKEQIKAEEVARYPTHHGRLPHLDQAWMPSSMNLQGT
jgi:hypothetical protein